MTRSTALTKREFEIAGLTALGSTEKEISTKLFLSVNTVHAHKKNLSKKIGANNIADITRYVIEQLASINAKDLILNHILDLKHPKGIAVMIVGLVLQIFTMILDDGELRKPKKSKLAKAKTEKVKRTRRVRKERDYVLTA